MINSRRYRYYIKQKDILHQKIEIKCPICEETFLGRATQKFCSKFCKNRNYCIQSKKNHIPIRIWKPLEKNCKFCGKHFIQKTHNQKYCCKECSIKYFKEKLFKIITGIEKSNKKIYIPFLKLRFEIFKRDNFRCQYCGRNPKEDNCKLHIEHIIPRSEGGTDKIDNLTTSCEECNLGKYDILLSNCILKDFEARKNIIESPIINELKAS